MVAELPKHEAPSGGMGGVDSMMKAVSTQSSSSRKGPGSGGTEPVALVASHHPDVRFIVVKNVAHRLSVFGIGGVSRDDRDTTVDTRRFVTAVNLNE